ncbi:UvrD-helicase domain-containing protein [candidate division KSB1 bacterium]|nr:UvrD-helicase domain-containing protein [candidate division KSB1 bacterium]
MDQIELNLTAENPERADEPKRVDKPKSVDKTKTASVLNKEQQSAVEYDRGPLLIVAGAGTGKTKVITHRIAHLISSKKARPDEILALTFTEKAAAAMEERVDLLVPYGYAAVWISTFHAFGDHILREFAFELGLPTDFQVLPTPEQIIFFKDRLFNLPLNIYRPLSTPDKFIEAIIGHFSRAKDEDITPQEYLDFAKKLIAEVQPDDPEQAQYAAQQLELAQTYVKYQELLTVNGKLDFGDLITTVLRLFREHPLALQKVQNRYKYVLVDEFQDTNYAQFQMVRLLAHLHGNITVVADDDQSIYKFRGAAISNILGFTEIYPNAKQVVLTENYRSTQLILDAAYKLICHNNPDRLEVQNNINKKLTAQLAGDKMAEHLHFDTLTSETEKVAQMIMEKVSSGQFAYKDFAILVRANYDADPFLRSLHLHRIPFQFSGSRGLYQREEIRMLISFLKAISDFRDYISLYNLAISEVYHFPMHEITMCLNVANRSNRTLHHVLRHFDSYPELEELSAESVATLKKLLEDIQKYLDLSRTEPTHVVLYSFIKESGYLEQLMEVDSIESDLKIQNIAKFCMHVKNKSEILRKDRVQQFVPYLENLIDAGDDPATAMVELNEDAVSVLTYHRAKGLEFKVVFMVSLLDQKFPSRGWNDPLVLPPELIKDALPSDDFHVQEERRLFYVGMTRAERELYLTSARDYGTERPRKVSQFVHETLDKPRADEAYIKASPLEALERFAPSTEDSLPAEGEISTDELLNLSHRKIDDYLSCPLKYKYIHILKVPVLPNHALIYGRAIHEAVGEYGRHKMNGKEISLAEVIKVFESNWSSIGFLTREHEEERLRVGKESLKRFYEEQEASDHQPALVEQNFSYLLGNNRLTGRWDRVDIRDGEVYIIDFKSSAIDTQDKADKRTKGSLQMVNYALAYEKAEGKLPKYVELHFLDTGLVGRSQIADKDVIKFKAKLKDVSKGIRARDYTPKPGYMNCNLCSFSEVCPATAAK